MSIQEISLRLQTIANFVHEYGPKPVHLADIGTDHAYLPIYLIQKDWIETAIAGEVAHGPLASAQKAVHSLLLEEVISVRLGNGLSVIKPDDLTNTVVIAGMGGALIRQILKEGQAHLKPDTVLILQPNVAEPNLREWLVLNQFELLHETVLFDHKHYYEIMIARKSTNVEKLTARELLFGPINLQYQTDLFKEKWERELKHRENIFENIRQHSVGNEDKLEVLEQQIELIKELLNHEANIDSSTIDGSIK